MRRAPSRKALRSASRPAVFAAPSGTPWREPALARQSRHRGAHQALGEAEGCGEADETAERHRPAARGDGIAEERDEKRAAAQRPLRPEMAQQGPNRGGGRLALALLFMGLKL